MPPAFTRCVNSGGRVRTKTLSNSRYMRVCYKAGRSYAGHVKVKMAKTRILRGRRALRRVRGRKR